MRYCLILVLVISGLSMIAPEIGAAKKPQLGERWIVELADPPTLEFSGSELAFESGARAAMPFFAATAPSVTGSTVFDVAAPEVVAYAGFLEQRQTEFREAASRALGRKLPVDGAVRHVANALILSIDDHEAERLRELPGVRTVYREHLYRLEFSAGSRLIGAPQIHQGGAGLPAAKGEGIVVGIIDSGINWNHRAFSANTAHTDGFVFQNPRGRQFGLCSRADVPCNNKLIGVYDFTNQSTNGLDTDGHGTHVAAIAAANEWSSGQAGVAPRANLISYRVCIEQDPDDPDAATCQSGAILQAFDQIIIDRVDVVNFSIGGGPLNPWLSTSALRVLSMRDAGISFVTSGGNRGPDAGTVGWPAEAPWVLAVGASTTDSCAAGQVQIQGLGSRTATFGTGPNSAGPAIENLEVRSGGAFNNNLRACQAFPPGVFNNAVALIERGDCTFETKVNNATAAGARAVLLFENQPSGRTCMAGLERTTVPSAMLSQSDGQTLQQRIQSSPPQRVSFVRDNLADQVASFSSRGPSENVPRVMKPNLIAPGAGIQAAYVPGPEDVAGLSGTSMASPHVAGAIALLRQLIPGLTAPMASSLLETTAETAPVTVAGGAAGIFDRGAGRIRVDLAARGGLYLNATRAQFLAANPSSGGDPGALNLPGMVNENCGSSCTFVRTVTAIRSGSWTVSGEGTPGVSVSPQSFALQAGQSRALTITITPSAAAGTALQHGAVVLTPAAQGSEPALVTQRLPLGVRSSTGQTALPGSVSLIADSNLGRQSVGLGFINTLEEASFPTSAWVKPQITNLSLPQDPNRDDPFDGSAGTRTFLIDVPPGTLALWAETTASSAVDIDLFVGRDDAGDGVARDSAERCRSVTPDALERCVIATPEPGRWWVVVQNWQASSTPQDSVRLELATLSVSEDTSLTAFGPGRHSAGPLSLDVAWDLPQLTRQQRWLGVIGVSGQSGQLAEVGVVPLALSRDAPLVPTTTILFPGETVTVAVPANGRHDRLVFDVPPSARSINVRVEGEAGVSGSLRRVPFAAIRDSAPASPAPSGAALATGSNSAAGFNLIRSSNVDPGRYFVELDNSASVERTVSISLTMQENTAVVPRFGVWNPVGGDNNPRDIAQGIEWQRAGNGFVIWYSFDATGLPVFFTGTTPLNPSSSVWVAEVTRFTRGAAGQQQPLPAGTVGITAISADEMVFSWRLQGGHGSDIKINPNAATCPRVDGQARSFTGTWFTPGQDQGGSSVIVTDNAQGHIRYYYDAQGFGRWVVATDGGGAPLAEELDVLEFRGFCPNCDAVATSFEVVGTYFRQFVSEDEGLERLEFVSRPPLDEVVTLEVPIMKLSERLACP